MKHLLFIPARAGSQTLKEKNRQLVGNLMLWEWAVHNAGRIADKLDNSSIVLSTDCIKTSKEAAQFCRVHNRPARYTDGLSYDIWQLVNYYVENDSDEDPPNWVWLLQPTNPFIADNIIQHLSYFAEQGFRNASSLQTIATVEHNSHWLNQRLLHEDNKTVEFSFHSARALNPRKQTKPKMFRFGNLVITNYRDMVDQKTMFTNPSYGIPIPRWQAVDIDDVEDLDLANMIYESKWKEL
jgi:CMP-N-acetylneuraminic acid synthetase